MDSLSEIPRAEASSPNDALAELLDVAELNQDSLEPSTRRTIERARKILSDAQSPVPLERQWSPEPATGETVFRVTQAVHGYRRYLVSALTWQAAKRVVEDAAPAGSEIGTTALPGNVRPLDDVLRRDAIQHGEVAFVDSESGEESYFERM